jgi:hypothetical protein
VWQSLDSEVKKKITKYTYFGMKMGDYNAKW